MPKLSLNESGLCLDVSLRGSSTAMKVALLIPQNVGPDGLSHDQAVSLIEAVRSMSQAVDSQRRLIEHLMGMDGRAMS